MSEEPFAGDIVQAEALIARLRDQLGRLNDEEEDARREARRAYSRAYYAAHRDEQRAYQKQQREKRKQADPERYRAQRRDARRRWEAGHRDEINAANRKRYQENRVEVTEARRQKYWADPETARRKRRESYATQKARTAEVEAALPPSATYRAELGMPVSGLHPVASQTRRRNLAEANAFFARPRSEAELNRIRTEGSTPIELLAAWERDSRRARAAHHVATQGEELARLHAELARLEKRRNPGPRAQREAEEARLDAIGRQVNERLRPRDRRPVQTGDPAAPHLYLIQHNQTGLQR
ncbi:MAG: hypothetical protein J0I43_03815 [Microbacterium sp.]|uniref:hypothetical protein n=1 Tax=Microbacterium sp. TaxID=51671 RepID=UPI001AD03A0C|nr:hypothetical protein [Microbacterium sp.]MBN9176478.1 hypothetical protein [Microbacterium sp.]